MKIEKTKLAWKVTLPFQHHDERGSIYQTWNHGKWWNTMAGQGFPLEWRQENVILENRGALRGIHVHSKAWLLITVLYGKVTVALADPKSDESEVFRFDIAIGQPTYQLLIPPGIGNGHAVHRAGFFHYFWSEAYEDEEQETIKWNDPRYNIDWGIKDPILSERDG